MQVGRFNPILCCSILRNAPHFFVSTSAIPVNRYLTECDFIRKTPPSTGQDGHFDQLIRETPPSHGQIAFRESIVSGIGAS